MLELNEKGEQTDLKVVINHPCFHLDTDIYRFFFLSAAYICNGKAIFVLSIQLYKNIGLYCMSTKSFSVAILKCRLKFQS